MKDQLKGISSKKLNKGLNFFSSMDGTDCPIREPFPFDRKWMSHKFKAAALRYDISLSIKSGDIVHAAGGVPAGECPDIELAGMQYCKKLAVMKWYLQIKGTKIKLVSLLPSVVMLISTFSKLYLQGMKWSTKG